MQQPGPGQPRTPGSSAPAASTARGSQGPARLVRQPRVPAPSLGEARGTGDKPPASPGPPPRQRLSQGVGWWPRTRLVRGGPAGHGAHGLGAARPSAAGCSQGAAEPSRAAQAGAHREKIPARAQTLIPREQRRGRRQEPHHAPVPLAGRILHPTVSIPAPQPPSRSHCRAPLLSIQYFLSCQAAIHRLSTAPALMGCA